MKLPWREIMYVGVMFKTSLLTTEASILKEAAKGRQVLEVGSAYGYSTCVMAMNAEHVYAVDPHNSLRLGDTERVLRENLEKCGRKNVTVCKGYSKDVLPKFHADCFDMAFIDGGHTVEDVQHDAAHAMRLVRPGGEIYFHDFGEDSCPGVEKALNSMFPRHVIQVYQDTTLAKVIVPRPLNLRDLAHAHPDQPAANKPAPGTLNTFDPSFLT